MIFPRILFWTPRILSIIFALFLSLFALDVFSENQTISAAIIAFLIHLVPTYIVIISLVVAWRWELIGSVLFTVFSLFYLASSRGESWIISGPLFLISILFLINWVYRKKRHV